MNGRNIEHSTSVAAVQTLPRLGTASSRVVEKEYKSGACYKGQVQGNRRVGRGVFTWPDGAVYEGEFLDNLRHGAGTQIWADGSCYQGDFVEDMRHGKGIHKWTNGETYDGEFFRDRRHGEGVYTWPDNSTYSGTFYMDKKEGYGTFTFSNSNKFEGLYKSDEREGPGVLSYPDGNQDVGLWHREKLVKLCTAVPGAFTMKNHSEFDYSPDDVKMYIDPHEIQNQTDVLEGIVNPPLEFDYPPAVDITDRTKVLFSDGLHTGSVAMDLKAFDDAFFKKTLTHDRPSRPGSKLEESQQSHSQMPKRNSPQVMENCQTSPDLNSNKMLAWNNTPSSIVMQLHIEKHKARQDTTSFSVEAILKGDRSNFRPKGPIELASEDLLQAAILGDMQKIKKLLNGGHVYVDVADKSGHTALMGTSVHWHEDVINCLLDNGADVNKLNDEGVSALAACHVYIYPTESFKYNTAEKNLVKPPDAEQEKGYDVNEAVKSLLPQSPPQLPKSKTPKSKNSPVSTKQIQRLRQEYKSTKKAIRELEVDLLKETKQLVKTENQQENIRKLGTLQVNRVAKINIDELMSYVDPPNNDFFMNGLKETDPLSDEDEWDYETEIQDFQSTKSVRNLPIGVSDQLIDRCATQLSSNELVVGRARSATSDPSTLGTVRRLAIDKSQQALMLSAVRLLLKRGADPNASCVPMPVLFFAIKAADVEAVRLLLLKGASTFTTLSEKKGGLGPMHIASAIPGPEGVAITELLLNSLADPDARAAEDDSFLNRLLEEEWSKDKIDENGRARSGGRTPLHIASARDDNYRNARHVVELLLQHHANPNLLCNGQSPLSLAVASGNDKAIDELLAYGADPNLPLTHGVGSALCQAASTEHESRRTPPARLQLIDKLIASGADVLQPIPIGPKRVTGTAVDYAHYLYNLDRRIAHMPYHALSHAERETFNARRQLLAHLGDIIRGKAVERERARLEAEESEGRRSASPGGPNFMYTGAGAQLSESFVKGRLSKVTPGADGRVSFGVTTHDYSPGMVDSTSEIRKWSRATFDRNAFAPKSKTRKPLFRYCYECGRSVGVRLSACTRCKEVYYCSKACKLKAWNSRHKEECVRVGGRSQSPSPARTTGIGTGTAHTNRIDSPTPATDPDRGKPTTVAGIMAHKDQRIKVPVKGRSLSAKGGRRVLDPIVTGGKFAGLHGGKYDKLFGNKLNGLAILKGLKYGSKSAGIVGHRGRNVVLEPIEQNWKDQYVGQRVWIDNYSWV